MVGNSHDFLVSILGSAGAEALRRAAQRQPSLGSLLVPRAALAWVQTQKSFDGVVPGNPGRLAFAKSESGLTGQVLVGDNLYEFANATPEHVAAALSVSVGAGETTDQISRQVLVRLGKSIDTLVQAQTARLAKRTLDPALGYRLSEEHLPDGIRIHAHDKQGGHVGTAWFQNDGSGLKPVTIAVDEDHQRRGIAGAMYEHAKKLTNKPITAPDLLTDEGAAFHATIKTELPGMTAKPRAQQGPEAAEPPKMQPRMARPKLPKPPKLPALKVEKSEMARLCPMCGRGHFEGQRYRGCLCTRDLAKSIRTQIFNDGVVLEFGGDSTRDVFHLIRKALKNGT
jgi:GNAT superfamily N-acetyltransferase